MKPIGMLRGDMGKCISRLKVGNVFQNKAKSRNNERVMRLDYFESTNNSQKLQVNYFIEKGGVGLLVGNLRNVPGYFDAFWGLRAAGIEGIDSGVGRGGLLILILHFTVCDFSPQLFL